MRIQTIRRKTGDIKPGQELHAAGSREPGNHYQKAPWNPVARGGSQAVKRGCRGPGQRGELAAASQQSGS